MGAPRALAEDRGHRIRIEHPLSTPDRLHLAARIHFALLRRYSENVGVTTLLADGDTAREALWVCDASGDNELMTLARRFRAAPARRALMPLAPGAATRPLR
jgi:hypothetical protein